jgi:methylmalonyl-CoA mutase cobalamin-binding subunit
MSPRLPKAAAAPVAPESVDPAPTAATPTAGYGIRAVAVLTGVDEHTLRIWERRYGFPRPVRSSGGARLYDAEDVHKLRLIGRALGRGHRPGEVVALDAGALEALLAVGGGESPTATTLPSPGTMPNGGSPAAHVESDLGESDLVEPLLVALQREDIDAVRNGLRQAALLLGPRRFVVELAQPLAVRVGLAWEAGEVEVHQEHLMTDCLSTQLRVLRSFFDDLHGPVVVLATLPREPHGLGLEMIALYLATSGLSPRVIGVSTPADQIVRAAAAHQAKAVGLAIMPSSDLVGAERDIHVLLSGLGRGTKLWLGGAGAARLPAMAGADVITSWTDLDAVAGALLAAR